MAEDRIVSEQDSKSRSRNKEKKDKDKKKKKKHDDRDRERERRSKDRGRDKDRNIDRARSKSQKKKKYHDKDVDDLNKTKQMEILKEREQQRQRDREMDKWSRDRQKNRKEKSREREKNRQRDKQRDRDREKSRDRGDRQREKEDRRDKQRDMQKSRQKQRDRGKDKKQKNREKERDRQASKERQRQKDKSRRNETGVHQNQQLGGLEKIQLIDQQQKSARKKRRKSQSRSAEKKRTKRERSYSKQRRERSRDKRREKDQYRKRQGFDKYKSKKQSSSSSDSNDNMSDDPEQVQKLAQMKAAKQLVSSKADRKLYLGNLPPNITSQQLMDMLNGALKKMEINTQQEGDSIVSAWISPDGVGHYAFVEFRSAQQATNGLTLNGASLFGYQLKLGRPKQYIEYNKTLLSEMGTDRNMETILKKVAALGSANIPPIQERIVCPPSKIVVLKYIVSIEELAIDEEYEEILQDVREMAKRFGEVVNIVIPRPHQIINLEEAPKRVKGLGLIFIEYKQLGQAIFARTQFVAKEFSGQPVACGFFNESQFREQDYDLQDKVIINF